MLSIHNIFLQLTVISRMQQIVGLWVSGFLKQPWNKIIKSQLRQFWSRCHDCRRNWVFFYVSRTVLLWLVQLFWQGRRMLERLYAGLMNCRSIVVLQVDTRVGGYVVWILGFWPRVAYVVNQFWKNIWVMRIALCQKMFCFVSGSLEDGWSVTRGWVFFNAWREL